jgi:hypothetical protein
VPRRPSPAQLTPEGAALNAERLLVTATVALFGRWNWWLPGPLAKILPARPAEIPEAPSPIHQAAHEQVPAGVHRLTPEGDRAQPEPPVTLWPGNTPDWLR